MTLENLRSLAVALESKPLADFCDKVEGMIRNEAVLAQRLTAAMEREKLLRADADIVPGLLRQIESMEQHPDVRAAKRASLRKQADEVLAKLASLEPKNDKPTETE